MLIAFAYNINGLDPNFLQFYQRPVLLLFLLYYISSFVVFQLET